MTARRDFLRAMGAGAALASPLGALACRASAQVGSSATPSSARGWDLLPEILARIVPPKFPERDFDITRYGATANESFDNTAAIRRAIEACSSAGGGRVVVPAGRFLTGPVHLESNVNLHVSRGATLAFTRDTKAYLPAVLTRFEGTELMNYSPLIYAFEQENIAVTGEGTLDGQANCDHWWNWRGSAACPQGGTNNPQVTARNRLFDMAERGVPVAQRIFGEADK